MSQRYVFVLLIAVSLVAGFALAGFPQPGDPIPTEIAEDPTYGYTEENPVKVGGGPPNKPIYLKSLRGPKGQKIKFKRLGSCCHFETPNGFIDNMGLLDRYEVTYRGLKKPVILYLNGYDHDEPRAPVGFTLGK